MADVLLLGIFIYLFYRFMVGFVIPIYKTTRHVRQQFSQMNSKTQNQEAPKASTNSTEKKATTTTKVGEYIDFEEVK